MNAEEFIESKNINLDYAKGIKLLIEPEINIIDLLEEYKDLSLPAENRVIPKIADLEEALITALSLWKIAYSPIGVTQDAMVEYKRRIDKLTEIVYPK